MQTDVFFTNINLSSDKGPVAGKPPKPAPKGGTGDTKVLSAIALDPSTRFGNPPLYKRATAEELFPEKRPLVKIA